MKNTYKPSIWAAARELPKSERLYFFETLLKYSMANTCSYKKALKAQRNFAKQIIKLGGMQ